MERSVFSGGSSLGHVLAVRERSVKSNGSHREDVRVNPWSELMLRIKTSFHYVPGVPQTSVQL